MKLGGVIVVWLVLLVLLGIEFAAAHGPAGRYAAPGIGIAMAVLVALSFMRLGSSRGLAPVFALAGVFWLLIMLGLGSLDPLTRHDLPVTSAPTQD